MRLNQDLSYEERLCQRLLVDTACVCDAAAARRVGAWAAVAAAALGLGLASVGAIIRARWQRTVRAQLV